MTEREIQILYKIIAHCDRISEYMNKTTDERAFLADDLLMDGVSMRILSIGELVKRLPHEFRQEAARKEGEMGVESLTDWRGLAGLRDYVAHDYDNVNYQIMYETALKEIPQLRNTCAAMLENSDKQ